MKKLFLAMLLSVMGHVLFDSYHAECLAASIQGSATVRLLSELRNPAEGTLGLEAAGIRLTASYGYDERESATIDLITRSRSGAYAGIGLVGDRLFSRGSEYTVTSINSDTTVTIAPHDHGKHKGDKHHRHGRKDESVTTSETSQTTVTIGGYDLGLSPSLILGVSARHGLFAESRVIFGAGGEMTNRTSVGLRF